MFRRRRSQRTTHHHTANRGLFDFMRKPAFQVGLVIFAVIAIIVIALLGQQPAVTEHPAAVSTTLALSTSMPDEISIGDAYKLYQRNGAYFLDVRERPEWDAFHIPKTTLLPLGQVAALADKFPKDKPIIVVCASGIRSAQGRDILKKAGYTNVTSLTGGVTAWKTQGYPIEP